MMEANGPANNFAGKEINDSRQVEEESVIREEGEIACPDGVGTRGRYSLDPVRDLMAVSPSLCAIFWFLPLPPRFEAILSRDTKDCVFTLAKYECQSPMAVMGMIAEDRKHVIEQNLVLRCLLCMFDVEG